MSCSLHLLIVFFVFFVCDVWQALKFFIGLGSSRGQRLFHLSLGDSHPAFPHCEESFVMGFYVVDSDSPHPFRIKCDLGVTTDITVRSGCEFKYVIISGDVDKKVRIFGTTIVSDKILEKQEDEVGKYVNGNIQRIRKNYNCLMLIAMFKSSFLSLFLSEACIFFLIGLVDVHFTKVYIRKMYGDSQTGISISFVPAMI